MKQDVITDQSSSSSNFRFRRVTGGDERDSTSLSFSLSSVTQHHDNSISSSLSEYSTAQSQAKIHIILQLLLTHLSV